MSLLLGTALSSLLLGAWYFLRLLPQAQERARLGLREQLRREADVVAKEQLYRDRDNLERQAETSREELREKEERYHKREEALESRLENVEQREREVDEREAKATGLKASLEAKEADVQRVQERQLRELERISELRREEAEHLLLDRIEQGCRDEAAQVMGRVEAELQEQADHRALDVLLTAVQRTALRHTHKALATVVPLTSDHMKGILVGRDGRNVRTFETKTGVDLLIDDTPGVVVISAFDPVRREIARRALTRLLEEGRIHPPRIEAVVADTRQQMEEVVQQLGRAAADEAGVPLPARLLTLLGRLEFCTSEGQNVRQHSLESAHLAGVLAGELGLNPDLARRCGLLHDIGKGVDHDTDGGHPSVGAEQASRAGEDPLVVNAIASHHLGTAPTSPYAVLVQIADRLSAERPGARHDQIELAIRRREEVENLVSRLPGVKHAYAVQAGREVRVIVDPDEVSDKGAQRLARDVARELEKSSSTIGEVKVTVVREVRLEEKAMG